MAGIPQIIRSIARQFGPKPLYMDIMSGYEMTWVEFRNRVWFGGSSLISRGIPETAGVALVGFEGVEGLVFDGACQAAGLVPFAIPAAMSADDVVNSVLLSRCTWFILDDSGAIDAPAIRAALEPLSGVAAEIPAAEIRMPASARPDSEACPEDPEIEARLKTMGPGHPACGVANTTPDGRIQVAALSDEGLVALAQAVRTELVADEADVWTSLLPLSNPFARIAGWYCCMLSGGVFSVLPPGHTPVEALYLVQPSFVVCDAPAAIVLEKGILSELDQIEGARGRLTRWGFERARNRTRAGAEPHGMLDALADLAVERLVRDIPGGALRAVICNSDAPLMDQRWTFLTADIDLWSVHAPASASCFLAVTRRGHEREGSIGLPLPGIRVTTSERGELVVSGPTAMVSEMCQPPDECIDLDSGNLRTGLRGHIDADGFIFVDGTI